MNGKRNTGLMTIVTIGDKHFNMDGRVRKDIMETLLSWKALESLTWTNHLDDKAALVLSESTFIENRNGDVLEVDIEEIDAYERRHFDNCLTLSKAIEEFIENT